MSYVTYDDFAKLDIRVAKIISTEPIPGKTRIIKGIIDGTKIITLTVKDGKTLLNVKWDIKLTGVMGMFTGMIKKHIESGTVQALQKIKEEIER